MNSVHRNHCCQYFYQSCFFKLPVLLLIHSGAVFFFFSVIAVGSVVTVVLDAGNATTAIAAVANTKPANAISIIATTAVALAIPL